MKINRNGSKWIFQITFLVVCFSLSLPVGATEEEPISFQLQQPSQFLAPGLNPLSVPTTAPQFSSPSSSTFEEKSIAAPAPVSEAPPYTLEVNQPADREPIQIMKRGGLQEGASTVGNTLYTPPSAIPSTTP